MQAKRSPISSPFRWLAVLCLLFLPCGTVSAQTSASNRVLHLKGEGAHVRLPPNIFNTLTQATVEGWVKWHQFHQNYRFFDFGEQGREMYVAADLTTGSASPPL